MFNVIQSQKSATTQESSSVGSDANERGEYFIDDIPSEKEEKETKKVISVGDSLPYGIRLYYGSKENIVRMKDVGVKKRILVVGVIGSFTPYCWNRHLFRVLQKSTYYDERDIDYICCLSTNDAYTQRAWGRYLGCEETVIMFSDATTRFTKEIGMDVVIPWLDDRVRSRRYIIYAEDMIVLKMIVAPNDGGHLNWHCEHLLEEQDETEDSSESYAWT